MDHQGHHHYEEHFHSYSSALKHQERGAIKKNCLNKSAKGVRIAGVLWIILGALAITVPFATAVTLEILVGCVFLIGGLIQSFASFRDGDSFGSAFLSGMLLSALGIVLLSNPFIGAVAVSVVIGASLLIEGATKFWVGATHGSGLLSFSGLLSVLLAIIIFAGWPVGSVAAIGVLFGASMIFSGLSMLLMHEEPPLV